MSYTYFTSLYLSVFMIVILFYGVNFGVLVLLQVTYIQYKLLNYRNGEDSADSYRRRLSYSSKNCGMFDISMRLFRIIRWSLLSIMNIAGLLVMLKYSR